MQNQLSTVTRLFTDTLYRIPDYQRGYAWGERQLKDFWSDIEQLNNDKSHYIGVLTLERVPELVHKTWEDDTWIIKTRKYQPYYVVDGQQRLTTIAILMHCIIDAIPEGEKIAFLTKEAIQKRYIFESKDDGVSKSFLFGYAKDNPSYEYLITQIFNEKSLNHSSNEVTIYTKNLRDAKTFFNEKIKSFSLIELEVLFQKVSQQLLFNTYEIAEEVDVSVAFETMNNRGKALSRLELLKNRLIYLSTLMQSDDTTISSLRKAVNEAWKDVYHFLGKNELRPLNDDRFLQRHLYLYYAKNILKINDKDEDEMINRSFVYRHHHGVEINGDDFLLDNLFSSKRLFTTEKDDLPTLNTALISSYAADMKSLAQYYYNISSPELGNAPESEKIWLERINRLQGYEPLPIVLFVSMNEKKLEKRIEFWELYERFAFVRSLVMESPTYRYESSETESQILQLLNGKKKLEDFSVFLENTIQNWVGKVFGDILSEWAKSGTAYYGWKRVKYFLFEYEMSLQRTSKSTRKKLSWDSFAKEKFESDYETVEHIYPQRARTDYWKSRFEQFSIKERAQLRNSLGNLLALSRPKNSSLGNKSFPDKLGSEATQIGYKFGCYSENEVAIAPDWNAEAIVYRGVKMLTFLEQRWKLHIGDEHQKIKALGIDFATFKNK
jgi:uncharacterized protein with ParB-like and HNH nuclease domain